MGTPRSTLSPTNDLVFRMLFSARENMDGLISLLNAVLRPPAPIASVEIRDPEKVADTTGGKRVRLDLLVRLEDGSSIDVEMQVLKVRAFPERALYYWARIYGTQLVSGEPYHRLRPVVSVLFLAYEALPGDRLHSIFELREIHDGLPFSDRLSIHVIELPKRRRGVVSSADADLLPWAQFLASETDEEVSEACMSNPVIEKTNRALEELSSNPETRLRALEREDELRLWEVELQAQFEHGLQEGRAEGRVEGRVEANAVTLLRLLRAKFGALDASTEARVRAASEAELERWLLAVLSAPDVASVFTT